MQMPGVAHVKMFQRAEKAYGPNQVHLGRILFFLYAVAVLSVAGRMNPNGSFPIQEKL